MSVLKVSQNHLLCENITNWFSVSITEIIDISHFFLAKYNGLFRTIVSIHIFSMIAFLHTNSNEMHYNDQFINFKSGARWKYKQE